MKGVVWPFQRPGGRRSMKQRKANFSKRSTTTRPSAHGLCLSRHRTFYLPPFPRPPTPAPSPHRPYRDKPLCLSPLPGTLGGFWVWHRVLGLSQEAETCLKEGTRLRQCQPHSHKSPGLQHEPGAPPLPLARVHHFLLLRATHCTRQPAWAAQVRVERTCTAAECV